MGGQYQPVGQAHVLSDMLDYGMDPQAALDCPRLSFQDGAVTVASRIVIDWKRGALVAGF
jgi:gamma-glutamyltranspeptidase/glutathione hydrolase